MSDKVYQENMLDNFTRLPCAQQTQSGGVQHYTSSYTSGIVNNSYNMQSYNMCDYIYGAQAVNRNQNMCPTSYSNCSDQLETPQWIADPRAVADIERGLKFTDKIETIEITSKDLSPASCCSNVDLLIPDVYKGINKDFYYKPTNNESQWYLNANCNNQRYIDYPSCSQFNTSNNYMMVDDKSTKCVQDSFSVKAYSYSNAVEPLQFIDYDKQITDKTYCHDNVGSGQLFADLNTDQFYGPSATICNDALSFVDMDNLSQQIVGDCSNDESDIIVEESDEEVTDYSEDLERKYDYCTNCIICNTVYNPVGSQFYILNPESPLTMSSQKSVFDKLINIVGPLTKKRNYMCDQCLSLINTIDHLELKLQSTKVDLLNKYEKTCKENNIQSAVTNQTNTQVATKPKNRTHRKFRNFCGIHSFACKLCKKLFSIKKLYRIHMTKHTLKNRFLCEICGRRFSSLANFKLHLKSHDKKVENPKAVFEFSCKSCKKLFRTNSKLKEHENYCLGILPFVCKFSNCDKKFATATKLKNHTKLKHDQKFTAICSICNIGFVKLSDYKAHKVTHSTEKKFNCTKCDKSYKTLSNLNYHMKFHNDKLPFMCTICNKGFMRKEYLEAHVNNHKGLKNYTCQLCGKAFVSQKNLDSHVKYHEGNIKKKVCNICNKSITTGFEEHLRTHSNLKEFECQLCEMKFNTKGALNKHVKRKHS